MIKILKNTVVFGLNLSLWFKLHLLSTFVVIIVVGALATFSHLVAPSPRLSSVGLVVALAVVAIYSLAQVVIIVFLHGSVSAWFARESRAKRVVGRFDAHELDLMDVVRAARAADGLGPGGLELEDGPQRFCRYRPRRLQEMVYALADEAYRQFGSRPRSEANLLITRKFMRDELSVLKDLRTCDAIAIIDGALGLSFLPSQTLRGMNDLACTRVYRERSNDYLTRWWWWPFGVHHQRS